MKIAFLGSSGFAIPALEALLRAGHDVVAAYCQPARPAGRGKRPRPVPAAERAAELGVPVREPQSFLDGRAIEEFRALGAEVGVVAAYGVLLPAELLEIPRFGFLNIHPSLLPRWRGAAPVQRAIMEGDSETGVCIMQVVEELDAGPVLLSRTEEIFPGDNAGTLGRRLSVVGASLLVEAVAGAGTLPRIPQDPEGASYARKIDKSETRIEWSDPAEAVDRRIRGLSPAPGAWCMIRGERVKLLGSGADSAGGPPGTALDDRLLIACGSGAVRIFEAQRPGKRPMPADEFLRGFPVKAGDRIE